MRRLRAQQPVEISLEHDDYGIDGRVVSVAGRVATVTYAGQIAPELCHALTPGSLAYLVFEHCGAMVALRGVASVAYKAGSELDFVVIDGVQLPDRRTAERVPLTVFARLSHLDSDGNVQAPTDTVTSNVSVSGALLERRGEVDERSRLRIEMFFAGEPAPVCREAVFARQTDTHVGVKFTDTQEADRVRLAGILFRHQRRSSLE